MEKSSEDLSGFKTGTERFSVGLGIQACTAIFLSLSFLGSAFAIMPMTLLQKYPYEELTLVKIHYRGKASIACFASMKGDIVWVGKRSPLGNVLGAKILRIEKQYVVVQEVILVNENDWIERDFKWPVAAENHVAAKRCGSPPTQKAQLDKPT